MLIIALFYMHLLILFLLYFHLCFDQEILYYFRRCVILLFYHITGKTRKILSMAGKRFLIN